MKHCEVCGHPSERTFSVTLQGTEHTFDSFECAIQALAPQCPHCGCRVIGHGMELDGTIFCCHHCADAYEAEDLDVMAAHRSTRLSNGVAVLQSPE
jgi:nitrite reductase/ring-hydroxylating ferredoxin subunit